MGVTTHASRESAAPVAARAASQPVTSRLRIGEPDDAYEREADRMADEVISGRVPRDWSLANLPIDPPVQRKCECGGSAGASGECEECKKKDKEEAKTLQRKADGVADTDLAPPIVHEVLNSPGQPLDRATREYFEPRFGADFSQVRVHADARAAESASVVHALAYTVGQDIAFRQGCYSPQAIEGKTLLAHELAHTLQQHRQSTAKLHRWPAPQSFYPAPASRVDIPPPPVPGGPDEARVQAFGVGQQWGDLLAQEDIAVDQLQSKQMGVSVWDRMTAAEKTDWAKKVEDEFAKLPTLADTKPENQAAQDQGFQSGMMAGYSATKFAAFMTKIGGEIALAIFAGVAARGLRLPRFIARALQASISEIVGGSTEYESLKAASLAAQAAHPELANLTTDEMVALRAYSKETWGPVNAALRIQNAREKLRLAGFIDLMKSGLSKLPQYSGTVARTISLPIDEAAARYREGATVVEDAFTSTTAGPGVAQREGNVAFTIQSASGRDISSIAAHAEKEVLFPPGTAFQITRTQRIGNALRVWLTEVPR